MFILAIIYIRASWPKHERGSCVLLKLIDLYYVTNLNMDFAVVCVVIIIIIDRWIDR